MLSLEEKSYLITLDKTSFIFNVRGFMLNDSHFQKQYSCQAPHHFVPLCG